MLHQPPHWLDEVAAVVTRFSPATARQQIALLYDMDCDVIDAPEVYREDARGLGPLIVEILL